MLGILRTLGGLMHYHVQISVSDDLYRHLGMRCTLSYRWFVPTSGSIYLYSPFGSVKSNTLACTTATRSRGSISSVK